jgi:hypothetical protein
MGWMRNGPVVDHPSVEIDQVHLLASAWVKQYIAWASKFSIERREAGSHDSTAGLLIHSCHIGLLFA